MKSCCSQKFPLQVIQVSAAVSTFPPPSIHIVLDVVCDPSFPLSPLTVFLFVFPLFSCFPKGWIGKEMSIIEVMKNW